MQKSLGYEIEILHQSKRQVNVKLQSLVISITDHEQGI